jgi:hypothetical protein
MQKRLLILLSMLLATTILVLCFALYLEIEFFEPVGLFQDKNLIEIPFASMKDPAARFAMNNYRREGTEQPTEEPTQPPTQPPEIPKFEQSDAIASRPLEVRLPFETLVNIDLSYAEVTESWFDDVLFIGDSRTVGLRDYARLGKADYFCSIGMTVFDALELSLSDQNFDSTNLVTLLQSKRYNKIYICLGLNECGYPYDLLMEGYETLVKTVQKYQPNAVVILQAMITVSRRKASSEWYFSLENLNKVNKGISELANGSTILYIDANERYADEEGYLPSDLTADGCHFDKAGYRDWAQWIYENAKTLSISFG